MKVELNGDDLEIECGVGHKNNLEGMKDYINENPGEPFAIRCGCGFKYEASRISDSEIEIKPYTHNLSKSFPRKKVHRIQD